MQGSHHQKIINAHMLERCSASMHGHFVALARFASPHYKPTYATLVGTPNHEYQRVAITLKAIREALQDQQLLSLELREFASN
ncbi:MAG: hypothetical protein EBZ69_02405 [Alphaproteobacteria bacterium]|nr:hypothetical protein [Alphaproteobacteria bacterium]NDC55654.1 hypothetical protein [Alphaproteobacteria bacterium]NDG05111.1 hypothetical protein [Alphaproteobacteria bacterium]